MIERVMELELPLGDRPVAELARRRVDHLRQMVAGDPAAVLRLVAAFRSLAAVYAASEADLARVVGPVVAARIRWFLDAPFGSSVDSEAREALSEAA
jgi:hypothetical protein